MDEIEVRCPQCKRLLFKVQGFGARVTCKCERCKSLVRWPSTAAEVVPPGQTGAVPLTVDPKAVPLALGVT